MEPRPLDFFISYANTPSDSKWAIWVAWQLNDAGYAVELDVWDWAVGANFVVRMSEALTRTRQVVALFSAAYVEPRRFTTEEWTAVVAMARDEPGRLVPLLIEPLPREAIPAVLRPLITVDLHGIPEDEAKKVLKHAVSRVRAVPPTEPGFPGGDPAAAPAPRAGRPPGAGVRTAAGSAAVPGSSAGVYRTDGRILSTPAVAGRLVLVGSDDGRLHAVDRRTMTPVWKTVLDGGPVRSSPVVDGESVYVGAGDGVHRLRLDSGTPEAVLLGEPVRARALTDRDTLYAVTENRDVVAVPKEDPAALRWRWPAGGTSRPLAGTAPPSAPALDSGTLYVGTGQGDIRALDAATGGRRWSWRIGDSLPSTPVVADGAVYLGSGHWLWALDAATGGTRWTYETRGDVLSAPAVSDGMVYAGSNDGSLYAVEAATGVRRWAFPTDRGILGTPLVESGMVYVAGYDGRLYAIDVGTGRRRWHFAAQGPLASSPVLADGVVYVGSLDHRLYAVHV